MKVVRLVIRAVANSDSNLFRAIHDATKSLVDSLFVAEHAVPELT